MGVPQNVLWSYPHTTPLHSSQLFPGPFTVSTYPSVYLFVKALEDQCVLLKNILGMCGLLQEHSWLTRVSTTIGIDCMATSCLHSGIWSGLDLYKSCVCCIIIVGLYVQMFHCVHKVFPCSNILSVALTPFFFFLTEIIESHSPKAVDLRIHNFYLTCGFQFAVLFCPLKKIKDNFSPLYPALALQETHGQRSGDTMT